MDATRVFAESVTAVLSPGDVVLLDGELGTGKTAFTQFLAAALGIEGPVTSPTFAIMNHYECAPDSAVAGTPGIAGLAHLDAYRLGNSDAIDQLGLFELLDDGCVAVIEWGSLVADAFDDVLRIGFVWTGDDSREVTMSARNMAWAEKIDQIEVRSGLARC
jgi:tRNA threonylcarbamoyladenosine biosynthesis protein TsaE